MLFARFPHFDHVFWFNQRRRNIALAAVELDVPVADDLPRLRAAGPQAHPVDDIIETALEQSQHVIAGDAFHHGGLFVVIAELGLEDTVDAARFLLLAKLQSVSHGLLHLLVLAMLPRDEVALLDSALLGVTALALQEQFHPFAPAQSANATDVSCRLFSRWISDVGFQISW